MLEVPTQHRATASAQIAIGGRTVGDIIIDAAKEGRADLIVMGTHGRSGVKRIVLGSIAEHVLRRAECPVVTVRGPR